MPQIGLQHSCPSWHQTAPHGTGSAGLGASACFVDPPSCGSCGPGTGTTLSAPASRRSADRPLGRAAPASGKAVTPATAADEGAGGVAVLASGGMGDARGEYSPFDRGVTGWLTGLNTFDTTACHASRAFRSAARPPTAIAERVTTTMKSTSATIHGPCARAQDPEGTVFAATDGVHAKDDPRLINMLEPEDRVRAWKSSGPRTRGPGRASPLSSLGWLREPRRSLHHCRSFRTPRGRRIPRVAPLLVRSGEAR